MTEQWRWGFWKWDSKRREHEFRPMSETDEVSYDGIVLATCEYGRRVAIENRGEQEALEVLASVSIGPGGETTIVGTDEAMALIEAAPKLLVACRFLWSQCRGRDVVNGPDETEFLQALAVLSETEKVSTK